MIPCKFHATLAILTADEFIDHFFWKKSSRALVKRGHRIMQLSVFFFSFPPPQKKLLQLWTELSNRQPWSLTKSLSSIDVDLAKIRYPTTTARPPRSITKCLKLKANECRVLLLICYPVFKKNLPEINYKHLQKLAFGITIGESSNIAEGKVRRDGVALRQFCRWIPLSPTIHRSDRSLCQTFRKNNNGLRSAFELQYIQFWKCHQYRMNAIYLILYWRWLLRLLICFRSRHQATG